MTNTEPDENDSNESTNAQISHTVSGLITLFLRVLILSLSLALLMSCIDALQKFGSAPLVLPFSALGQYQPQIQKATSQSPLEAAFDSLVLWYNCAFPGGSRLGSGIGTIFACFWTLHTTPKSPGLHRIVLGAVAGALLGFRMTLMLSSNAYTVLAAGLLGAVAFSVYMVVTAKPDKIPPLPIIYEEVYEDVAEHSADELVAD